MGRGREGEATKMGGNGYDFFLGHFERARERERL
jgi:hypothetical protein